MTKLDDMDIDGRSIIGAPYTFWNGRLPFPASEPIYMSDPADVGYVKIHGINCTGLFNWMRLQVGLDSIGGMVQYGNELLPISPTGNPSEAYDDSKWYPCGTFLVQPFGTGAVGDLSGVAEGHVAMISRPNQLILQAIHKPIGVTEDWTASGMHAGMLRDSGTGWEIAGWLADIPAADGLPGWRNGVGGVDGYPGDTATPEATAAWMARVAEDIYGLPGILPVMTSCVELTQAFTGPGDVKDVPGYLSPVDHCSVGFFQQQADDLGCGAFGWGTRAQIINAEYALSKFLDAALDKEPSPVPTDAAGLGAWCQAVQGSAVPDAYTIKGFPMAQKLLLGASAGHGNGGMGSNFPGGHGSDVNLPTWARNGWIDISQMYHPERSGIDPKGTWLEILDDGTLKFHKTFKS